MQASIYGEDIHILLQFFQLPTEDVVICDPLGLLRGNIPSSFKRIDCPQRIPQAKVIINLSERSIGQASFDFLLEFGKKTTSLDNYEVKTLNYICNPDGTMRWLFPNTARRPAFLNLYNGNSWKAKLYRRGTQMAFRLGLQSFLVNGAFSFYSKKRNYLQDLFGAEYALFTGTVGQNRKGIAALQTGKKCSHFLKIPLSEPSQSLVNNEGDQLNQLQQYSWKHLHVPTIERQGNAVRLSNIRPTKVQQQAGLTNTHIEALRELYQTNLKHIPLGELPVWKHCEAQLAELSLLEKTNNGLPLFKLQQLTEQLQELQAKLDPFQSIQVAPAHGDFTPWNMYLHKDQLYVYDWELATNTMPVWYDAFHFLFQQNILIQRSSFSTIQQAVDNFEHKLSSSEKGNFRTHYQLYLLFNCSYYLSLYANQSPLHLQVHWLLDTWLEAIPSILQHSSINQEVLV